MKIFLEERIFVSGSKTLKGNKYSLICKSNFLAAPETVFPQKFLLFFFNFL